MQFMKYSLFVALCIVLFSCSKDPKALKIQGDWNWVESTGGFAGLTLTPESEGLTRSLRVDDTTFKYFENGELKETFTYRLDTYSGNKPCNFCDFVVLGRGLEKFYVLEEDSLQLIDQCDDCFNHIYERK